jgi:hypothetical protein
VAPRRDLAETLAFDGRAVTATCPSHSIAVSDITSVVTTRSTGVMLVPASVVSSADSSWLPFFFARARARACRSLRIFCPMGDGGTGVTD